ncbi:MAG: hypothetical protein ACLR78_11010 [Roseburia sp.]
MAGFATAETAQEYWKEYRKHPVSGCFFVSLSSSILTHQSIPRKYWIRQNMLLPHFWENVKKIFPEFCEWKI